MARAWRRFSPPPSAAVRWACLHFWAMPTRVSASFFNFYTPTGALSGVTDTAIIVWLASWYVLAKRWSSRDVAAGRVSLIAFMLLVVGLLLTFPPFMDLLQGK